MLPPDPDTVPVAPPPSAEVSGSVRTFLGIPASGADVWFWPQKGEGVGEPHVVKADGDGAYRVLLQDGLWTGRACGSAAGYRPAGWEVVVSGGQVTRFQELGRARVRIGSVAPDAVLRPGDAVTVAGSGFGCSGSVVIEFPLGRQVVVTEFLERGDGRLLFRLPDPEYGAAKPAAPKGKNFVLGSLAYRHGPVVSEAVGFRLAAAPAAGLPSAPSVPAAVAPVQVVPVTVVPAIEADAGKIPVLQPPSK